MSRAKLVVAACFAVFALSTLAASTASAGWDVNGAPLSGSANLASSALILAHGFFEWSKVKVECTAPEVSIAGGKITSPNEISATSLTFKKCSTAAPCTLSEENIKTNPIHGFAQLDGPLAVLIRLLPLPAETFATITFEGATCALEGNQVVKGTVKLLAHEGQDPRVLQRVLVFALPGELHVGKAEAKLEGLIGDVKLESGATWNYL